jgi:hypothetical protein
MTEGLAVRTLKSAVSDTFGAVNSLYRAWFLLLLLLCAGLLLDALRTEIIWMSPWVGKHIKLITTIWNIIGEILGFIVAFIDKAFADVLKFLHRVPLLNLIHFKTKAHIQAKFAKAETDTIVEIFYLIPRLCADHMTGMEILSGIWNKVVGQHACYLLRALYPTRARHVSQFFFGWAAGGREPAPLGYLISSGSCEIETMSWLCVAFGSGALLLEILLPAIIFVIALFAYRNAIANSYKCVLKVSQEAVDGVFMGITAGVASTTSSESSSDDNSTS